MLARLHVKATFFIVGMKAAAAPDLVRAMFDAGHCLANHTYHHPRLTKITIAKVAQELQLCGDTLKAITGETPRYFRPPGGQIDPEVLKMAEAHGYKTIMWSYNTGDYKGFTADHLYAGLVKSTHNGSIILMHDGMPESLVLLPRFVATMREKGYSFVTIDQMAQDGMTTGR